MADPLSIAAGIAGLLSLGIQVTQSLTEYYSAYKEKDNDLAKMVRNLGDLQNTLQSLETAVHDCQSQKNAYQILKEVEKSTQRCQEIIGELQKECQKFHREPVVNLTGRIRVAGRRAAYPFRRSTLQKLAEDISAIRENLSLALDVLQLKVHNKTQHDLSEIKLLLERINTSHLSSTIHNWLKAPDASIDHNAACEKRHKETGLWFINSHQFTNWLVAYNSFLWIQGFAGCGKSVLCSTAIQHTFHETKDKHAVGIAFFYFSFNDEAKQKSHGMLCAFIFQLSVQLQNGGKDLERLYEAYKSRTPPVDVLLDSLHGVLSQFQEIYLFLDALDESPRDSGRDDVLRIIEAIRKWSLPGLHLLVTSRNHLDIHQSLDPSHGQAVSMENPEIDRDIVNFVSDQLQNDTKLRRWNTRHAEIQEQLTQKAQGVFRYVQCQLTEIKRALNRNQLDRFLHALPRDLDETYERILSSIDEAYVHDVRRILTLLCFSTRPLTIDELLDAHAVDLGAPPHLDREGRLLEQNDIIDICMGLMEVVEDKAQKSVFKARIAHFSVQEYLQSERIQQRKGCRFALQSGPANTEISQICLVYLLEPMLSNGILDIPRNEEFPLNPYLVYMTSKEEEFPLASYAAQNWYRHYIHSQKDNLDIEQLLQKLFQHHDSFIGWASLNDMDYLPYESRFLGGHTHHSFGSPLYYASLLGIMPILHNIIAVATKLENLSETVNAEGGWNCHALQAASARGHVEIVQTLLDHGADVNAQGGFYGNALQTASSYGHEVVVQMLLDHGADVNAQGGRFRNALEAASFEGHEKVIEMLLSHGAEVNAKYTNSNPFAWYGNALHIASAEGYVGIVQKLLEKGAEVNAQEGRFANALQVASASGYVEIVQMLLDKGADINAQGGEYGNALQAASVKNVEIVQMLLEKGADINAQGGRYGNALQAASASGYVEIVQMLLDKGADINSQGGEYGNALQAAFIRENYEIVQILLEKGADINAPGSIHGNALQAASIRGNVEVVQMLLKKGADINAQGGKYGNALQAASIRGNVEIVQMLLEKGADINAQGGEYGNALQAASASGYIEIVQTLLEKGADNAQNGRHGNALQAASARGHVEIVQTLLEKGADNAQDGRHGNALQSTLTKQVPENYV